MYLLTLFFPIISFLILATTGRYLGTKNSIKIALTCLGSTFLVSLNAFYEVALKGYVCVIKLTPWFETGSFVVEWGFLFDVLTVIMLCVVSLVSFLVHTYSVSYMSGDPHIIRFMSYLSLFTFFMLVLVTASNYVQLFVGWEGVGLCSYLLVNFWFTREQANKAAMKAIIVNRIGDFFFLLALILIFYTFKSFDFLTINSIVSEYEFSTFYLFDKEVNLLTFISFFILLAAVGKSAQLGLHTWLPDAMEGPTPVSALIHAATMVTAGIFLVLRASFILEYSSFALATITIFGALTAIFASTNGLFQNDLKKVIAYSTCSQLGYMFLACGASNYSVAMFHLYNHAIFKALLFLCAGVVIHALCDEQDMRKMGGLYRLLPFTYIAMFIGSIALAGFPFLTGFYSKDVIIESIATKYSLDATFAYILASTATFFTAFYSFRLLALTFLGQYKGSKIVLFKYAHDAPFLLGFPLFVLVFGTIFIGYASSDMFIGAGTDFFANALVVTSLHETAHYLPNYIKLLPFEASLFGIFLGLCFYSNDNFFLVKFFKLPVFKKHLAFSVLVKKGIYSFFSKKWYFDNIYNNLVVKRTLNVAHQVTFKTIDRGFIEIAGPLTAVRFFFNYAHALKNLQTGYLYHYMLFKILGVLFFLLLTALIMTPILVSKSFYILVLNIFIMFGFLQFKKGKHNKNKMDDILVNQSLLFKMSKLQDQNKK